MVVLIISECSGSAIESSQSVLDTYLPRIGSRIWSGPISSEGLDTLRKKLAQKTKKNTSLVCYRIKGTKRLVPVWSLGNTRKFNSRWHVSIKESGLTEKRYDRPLTHMQKAIMYAAEMAGYLHDIGKATALFQNKLRSKTDGFHSDPIRHEYVSHLLLEELCKDVRTDGEWLALLADEDSARETIGRLMKKLEDGAEEKIRELKKVASKYVEEQKGGGSCQNPNADYPPIQGFLYDGCGRREKSLELMAVIAGIVLTHHRLAAGAYWNDDGDLWPVTRNHVTLQQESDARWCQNLTFAADLRPLTEEGAWISALATCAKRLQGLLEETDLINNPDFPIMGFLYGRNPMMLADHRVSSVGNQQSGDRQDILYANTNRMTGVLAQPLAEHLLKTGRYARRNLLALTCRRDALPALLENDLPEGIVRPREKKDSPFRWQVDARNIVSKHMKKLGDDVSSGFFGILMAGTGTGKTKAAPIIMRAASGDRLRYSLALGLRTLTLQSGDEYVRDLMLPEDAVNVVIGSELAQALHRIGSEDEEQPDRDQQSQQVMARQILEDHPPASKDRGTEGEYGDLEDIVVPLGSRGRYTLPSSYDSLLPEGERARNLLAAPILVSTIDTLMPVADARRGRHLNAFLRVATSDLILDEIDDYSEEDLVAIGRLVFLCGAYGRRLILSSATISPTISKTLFRAYRDGYRMYCRQNGIEVQISCGWFSEHKDVSRIQQITDINTFAEEHNKVARKIAESLRASTPRRRVRIGDTDSVSDGRVEAEYFDRVIDHVQTMHRINSLVDPKSGKRLSLGIVRWNNVKPSIQFVEHLLKQGLGKGVDFRVIAYNGTLLPVTRFETEKLLDGMLKRKGDEDPVFRYPAVRDLLDHSKSDDCMIIVSSTSIEEVGRDHDFDWAITEPCSTRSIIQMAGRVRRHRFQPYNLDNVCILAKPLRFYTNRLSGKEGRVLAYPGVETPVIGNRRDPETAKFVLDSYDAHDLYDVEQWSNGITAADVVLSEQSDSNLIHVETRKLTQYLESGFDCALSVADAYSVFNMMICDYHPSQRQFRRNTGAEEVIVCVPNENNTIEALEWKNNKLFSINHRIQPINISDANVLPKVNVAATHESLKRKIDYKLITRYELLSFAIRRQEKKIRLNPLLGAYVA